jgi:hypothetical protein
LAGEDHAYIRWVKAQRCCACGWHWDPFEKHRPWQLVRRWIEAHHHTQRRSFGRRAHDRDAMPLCNQCHWDFHHARGEFSGWTRDERRTWQSKQVELQLAAHAEEHDLPSDEAPDDSEDIF